MLLVGLENMSALRNKQGDSIWEGTIDSEWQPNVCKSEVAATGRLTVLLFSAYYLTTQPSCFYEQHL